MCIKMQRRCDFACPTHEEMMAQISGLSVFTYYQDNGDSQSVNLGKDNFLKAVYEYDNDLDFSTFTVPFVGSNKSFQCTGEKN